MAHQSITPSTEDRYNAGDALDIPIHFYDANGENRVDITGATVEFRVKEQFTDSDADAVLEKVATEGGADAGTTITFDDATVGKVTVHIDTNDTSGFATDDSGKAVESKVYVWHCRVIDAEGRRVTAEWGEWEMFNT